MRRKLEERGYEVVRYCYPPGTRFGVHTHSRNKVDAVLAGRFRIAMGDESVVLEAGDCVEVPAGAEHTAEVVGTETVVSLDAVRR
jgi:mannose-6-phosphate isomerase-like protein (cupin superfamily)